MPKNHAVKNHKDVLGPFRLQSHAFGDVLAARLRLHRISNVDFADQLNDVLAKNGLKKTRGKSSITAWTNGTELPKDEQLPSIASILQDKHDDLRRALEMSREPQRLARKYRDGMEVDFKSNEQMDWVFRLCEPHIRARFDDPVWGNVFRMLLLQTPDKTRSFLTVTQNSFGKHNLDEMNPGTSGFSIETIGASQDEDSAKYLAMGIALKGGFAAFHEDRFPGFEYSVVVSGTGACFVCEGEQDRKIYAYALKPGSVVGHGAAIPHLVVASRAFGPLKLNHFCFPYRRAKQSERHRIPTSIEIGKERIPDGFGVFHDVVRAIEEIAYRDEKGVWAPADLHKWFSKLGVDVNERPLVTSGQ